MLAEIVVVARVLSPSVLPRDHGRAVRGWVYHLLGAGDPELAEQLHLPGGADESAGDRGPRNQKPFTCSELLDTQVRDDGLVSLPAGATVRLRLTTLSQRVFEALGAGLGVSDRQFTLAVRDDAARRDRVAELEIINVSVLRLLTYPELTRLPGSRQWRLSFLSRTAFSSAAGDQMPDRGGGEPVHWLLPSPRLVLANLLAKWNQFAPDHDAGPVVDVEQFERALHGQIVVARVQELWTEPNQGEDLRGRGFRGTVDLQLVADLPRAVFDQFTALMNFAPFAGVGARTTEGWGQVAVRRLRPGVARRGGGGAPGRGEGEGRAQ